MSVEPIHMLDFDKNVWFWGGRGRVFNYLYLLKKHNFALKTNFASRISNVK